MESEFFLGCMFALPPLLLLTLKLRKRMETLVSTDPASLEATTDQLRNRRPQ
jgi:hypothetical protein